MPRISDPFSTHLGFYPFIFANFPAGHLWGMGCLAVPPGHRHAPAGLVVHPGFGFDLFPIFFAAPVHAGILHPGRLPGSDWPAAADQEACQKMDVAADLFSFDYDQCAADPGRGFWGTNSRPGHLPGKNRKPGAGLDLGEYSGGQSRSWLRRIWGCSSRPTRAAESCTGIPSRP